MQDRNQPPYGFGRFDRPLWSVRDRDAEPIREILHRAGCGEFTLGLATWQLERHGEFVVDDGEQPASFLVAGAGPRDAEAADEVRRCARALTAGGYQVTPDPDDELVLQMRPQERLQGRR